MRAATILATLTVAASAFARGAAAPTGSAVAVPRSSAGRRCAWLAAALALLPGVAGPGAARAATRPNIVFVLADDMRADDLVATPKIESLVGGAGMTLRKAFVDVPICAPSRATTLTGQYAQNTGVFGNVSEAGGYQAFRSRGNEAATIGTMLRAAGYRTALIGKYENSYPLAGQTDLVPPGWDYWAALAGGYYKQYGYDIVETDGSLSHYGSRPQDYAGDVLRQRELDFIGRSAAAGRPFMLYLAFVSPHEP